jgi:hypothetical protein
MLKILTRYHIKKASLGIQTDIRALESTLIVHSRVNVVAIMKSLMLYKDSTMMVIESSMCSKRKVINATKSTEIFLRDTS